MSKQFLHGWMESLLFVLAASTVGTASAQGNTTQIFTPPGMPVLTDPGSVRILPSSEIDSAASPFTSDKRAEMAAARQAAKKRGWNEVTEAQAKRVDSYFDRPESRNRLRALHEIVNDLRVMPAALSGTALANAEFLGASPSGAFAAGGWTGLVRAFTVPKFGRVVLEEFDYAAAGTQITVPREMIDGDVNGKPMITDSYRAPSGNGYTEFTWFTDHKQFILRIGQYVPEKSGLRADIHTLMSQLY
ncbi:MAG TPA: hypothetical protein PKE27_09580 [Povalibacter sp.]|uniref:hypothetical protein n=1 Tax=Povalibacter sp. TaxID=1962978 RepID=UPI002B529EAF|nr:hypothetical protein [Povalibacter sp.]HMN44812.1 hypothetical protein [Povalibacter sp.]